MLKFKEIYKGEKNIKIGGNLRRFFALFRPNLPLWSRYLKINNISMSYWWSNNMSPPFLQNNNNNNNNLQKSCKKSHNNNLS
jgi:hypothetical protein